MWNVKSLPHPAKNTYKATDKSLDLNSLNALLNEAKAIFAKDKLLRLEGAFLTRIIYRLNFRYHNDKSFKAASKTNKALSNFLKLNINSIISAFLIHLPADYTHETYLPNRNLLDHVLVRTQGTGKLLCRIAECARETAFYLENKLHIGHLWKEVFMMLSIIARIFVITKYLAKYVCTFYNRLINFRKAFKTPSTLWVNKNYEFPSTLEDFLQTEILEDKVIEKPEYIIKWPKLIIDESDVEFMSEYIDISNENNDLEFINEYVEILDDNSDVEEIIPQMKAISNSSKTAFNKRIPNLFELTRETDEDIGEVVQSEDAGNVEETLDDSVAFVASFRNAADDSVAIVEDFENIDDSVAIVENESILDDTIEVVKDLGDSLDSSIEIVEDTTNSSNVEDEMIQNENLDDTDIKEIMEITDEDDNKKTFSNVVKTDFKKDKVKLIRNAKKKNKQQAGLRKSDDVFGLSTVKSFEDLSMLVKLENKNRKINSKNCKFKHLNKLQWNMLCNSFRVYVNKSGKDKKNKKEYLEKAKLLFQSG